MQISDWGQFCLWLPVYKIDTDDQNCCGKSASRRLSHQYHRNSTSLPHPKTGNSPWWYRETPGMTCHLLSHLHFSGQLVGSPLLCPARQKVNTHPKRGPAKEWDDKKWQFLPSFPSTPFICERRRSGPHLPLVCADGPACGSRFTPRMKPAQYLHSCGVRDTIALTQKCSNSRFSVCSDAYRKMKGIVLLPDSSYPETSTLSIRFPFNFVFCFNVDVPWAIKQEADLLLHCI